jgi:predicted RNase H-like nuclease
MNARWVAGVDGCRAGWIAALRDLGGDGSARIVVVERFSDLLALEPALRAIAVDMPIGLPDRITGPGRAAEQAARAGLGARQSSLFAIPARAAVEATDYRMACAAARAHSDPPRAVAKQAFNIFAKIRELDALLLTDARLAGQIVETHPEVIFARLAGAPLAHAKKSAAGAEERRSLLIGAGVAPAHLAAAPPRGAARDDMLDAFACSIVAARRLAGLARPSPNPPGRDAHGLPVAIWF